MEESFIFGGKITNNFPSSIIIEIPSIIEKETYVTHIQNRTL